MSAGGVGPAPTRVRPTDVARPSAGADWAPPSASAVGLAAALAAAVLAGTSTGSAVVVAVLLGVACRDPRAGAAAVLAVLATAIRFRTATLDDLAGIQSVLGAAGVVGPALAAASAWAAAAAVVLAAGPLAGTGSRWVRLVPALPAGLLAAALAAGPGPSDLGLRVVSSVAGVALAAALIHLTSGRPRAAGDERTDRFAGSTGWSAGTEPQPAGRLATVRPSLALAAGVTAVVLAGWPS